MDIYEYLKMDHKTVSDLFAQFLDAKSSQRKREIIEFLGQELFAHARAEQNTFYKELQRYDESQDEVHHGKEEHEQIEVQLKEVLNAKTTGAAWEKKVIKLKELVDHHVNEEEGKIFRKAKKVLSDEEAVMLKEKMHYLKPKYLKQLD